MPYRIFFGITPSVTISSGGGMSHWVCEECLEEIIGDDGCVLVYNGDPSLGPVGGFPCHPPEPEVNLKPFSKMPSSMDEWVQSRRDRWRLRYLAVHDKCNPFDSDEFSPYYISLGIVPTLDKWVRWMDHVSRKSWMTKADLNALVQYWYDHKAPD